MCVCVGGWAGVTITSAIYSTCTRTSTKIQTQKVNSKSQRVLCEYVYVVHAQYEGTFVQRIMYEGTKVLSTFVPSKVLSYYVGLGFFDFFFLRPQSFSDFLAN